MMTLSTRTKPTHYIISARWFMLLTFPFTLGVLIFTYFPIAITVFLSFFHAYNTIEPKKFAGIHNYTDLLHDSNFHDSLITFFIYSLAVVPLTYVIAFSIALLLHHIHFGKTFFRTIVFLPTACSCVTAAIIWKLSLFNGVRFGAANIALKATTGHSPIAWLYTSNPPWYWLVVISLRLWLQTGFYVILFLAGLGRIDKKLYEAATLDGVQSSWLRFRYITFPSMKNISTGVIVLLLINAFQAFDEFYNLLGTTNGYPPYARPPLIYLYYTAMGDSQDFGHAGAGSVIILIVIYGVNSSRNFIPGGLFRVRNGTSHD